MLVYSISWSHNSCIVLDCCLDLLVVFFCRAGWGRSRGLQYIQRRARRRGCLLPELRVWTAGLQPLAAKRLWWQNCCQEKGMLHSSENVCCRAVTGKTNGGMYALAGLELDPVASFAFPTNTQFVQMPIAAIFQNQIRVFKGKKSYLPRSESFS